VALAHWVVITSGIKKIFDVFKSLDSISRTKTMLTR